MRRDGSSQCHGDSDLVLSPMLLRPSALPRKGGVSARARSACVGLRS